jgi:hypothetical protein
MENNKKCKKFLEFIDFKEFKHSTEMSKFFKTKNEFIKMPLLKDDPEQNLQKTLNTIYE